MSIELGGKSYETDEEGYLVNLSDWNDGWQRLWPGKTVLSLTVITGKLSTFFEITTKNIKLRLRFAY